MYLGYQIKTIQHVPSAYTFVYLCRGDVGDTRKGDDNTFLTQANVEDDGSFEKLPQIQQTSLQSEAQAVS